MPDALAQTLAMPGLGWILATSLLAGLVYGFAGFGSALIFMPVASTLIPLETAFAAFNVSALASVFTVLPGALRQVERRGLAIMIPCAVVAVYLGLWVLRSGDVTALRWGVVAVTSVTLAALMTGWRYETRPNDATRAGIGFATGFVGGATGLLGPVMILFQLSGRESVARSRATTAVFLTVTTALTLPMMAVRGLLTVQAILLGILLLVPYGTGSRVGAALFRPSRERLYRGVAYVIIACAIMVGLPVWD